MFPIAYVSAMTACMACPLDHRYIFHVLLHKYHVHCMICFEISFCRFHFGMALQLLKSMQSFGRMPLTSIVLLILPHNLLPHSHIRHTHKTQLLNRLTYQNTLFLFLKAFLVSRLTSQSMELIANNFVLYMHFIVSGIFMMDCFATNSHRLLPRRALFFLMYEMEHRRGYNLQFKGRYMQRL